VNHAEIAQLEIGAQVRITYTVDGKPASDVFHVWSKDNDRSLVLFEGFARIWPVLTPDGWFDGNVADNDTAFGFPLNVTSIEVL
jgi:hypothetical protein